MVKPWLLPLFDCVKTSASSREPTRTFSVPGFFFAHALAPLVAPLPCGAYAAAQKSTTAAGGLSEPL